MKAIISNGKRNEIYAQSLEFELLQQFISKEFPKMQSINIYFKDKTGHDVPIQEQEDLQTLKKVYTGQNFVEIRISGEKKNRHHHNHHKHHSHEKDEKRPFKNRFEKRALVLSKACGGEPKNYMEFVQQNKDLKIGELIKLYSQKTGTKIAEGFEKNKSPQERRVKILRRVYGGEIQDYREFENSHKQLNIGQLIREFAKIKGLPMEEDKFSKKNEAKFEKKKQRLAKFLGKSVEEVAGYIEKYPQLNVKQILQKLNEEKVIEFNLQKFKQFKKNQCRALDAQRKARKSEKKKHHSKHHHSKGKARKSLEKSEQTFEKTEKVETQVKSKSKQQQMRAKGKILLTMKQLFGEGNGKEYFKFINENFELGEEAIIQKWIQANI